VIRVIRESRRLHFYHDCCGVQFGAIAPVIKEKLSTMSSEIDGKTLHDKATRGVALTDEEHALLAACYKREDEAEARIINTEGSDKLASLQARVNAVLVQLKLSTERIQVTEAENERLRREIAELRRQLANATHRSDYMSISELEDYEERLARGEIQW